MKLKKPIPLAVENLVRNVHVKGMTFQGPIFTSLVKGQTTEGRLPIDPAAHALWNYYCVASSSHKAAKENLVYEGDPSKVFNAENVFRGIAMMYAVDPDKMQRYWPLMQQQRIALGLGSDDDIPQGWKLVGKTN